LLLSNKTNRQQLPALLLVLLLGFAVFLWGMRYKLSLYQSDAAQRAVPAAKLLSQKERPVSSDKLANSFIAGQPLCAVFHKTPRNTHTALPADAYLEGSYLSEELLDKAHGRCVLQLPCALSSSPRAPPIAV